MTVAMEKIEGPAVKLVFLGIEVDSLQMQLRLPLPKLQGLQAMVNSWLTRRSATKRELLSLIGHCQHAASVVKPGRTFLHPSSVSQEPAPPCACQGSYSVRPLLVEPVPGAVDRAYIGSWTSDNLRLF